MPFDASVDGMPEGVNSFFLPPASEQGKLRQPFLRQGRALMPAFLVRSLPRKKLSPKATEGVALVLNVRLR